MKKTIVLLPILLVALFVGCDARNPAESELISIADEAKAYAAKLPGLPDAATVNTELDQLSNRINFHTGQLANMVAKKGQERVRGQLGMDARNRFNTDLQALITAITAAEKRLGAAAIADGVGKVKAAVRTLSSTL